ncbi:hypothetical protein [Paenarthrobacter sp. NPDC090522]|uniref:hypothetical protein n=1 Tax=Paenarthrobacter sp. NPDC090522 TaxID=3364383 RepID=UPI00380156EE
MNKNALRGFAVSGLLVMGLTACGGAGTSTDAASAPASESATATPTPTPTPAKEFTLEDLNAVLAKMTDKRGTKLSVTSTADLSGSMAQSKALMEQVDVQPAVCKDMAMGSLARPLEGVKAAVGVSQDAASGSISTISLGTGLGDAIAAELDASKENLAKCGTLTMNGPTGSSTMTVTDLGAKKPAHATVAYRMDTAAATGEKGSMILAQTIDENVLVSVIGIGGTSEADAIESVSALLDQAVELIK